MTCAWVGQMCIIGYHGDLPWLEVNQLHNTENLSKPWSDIANHRFTSAIGVTSTCDTVSCQLISSDESYRRSVQLINLWNLLLLLNVNFHLPLICSRLFVTPGSSSHQRWCLYVVLLEVWRFEVRRLQFSLSFSRTAARWENLEALDGAWAPTWTTPHG